MNKISVVISAYNEEERIESCLKSVRWADEIVFIDNSSTDKTVLMAQKYTRTILKRPNYPMLNINKNFGFTKANGDWILNLDADERVDSELEKEIKEKLDQPHLVNKDGQAIVGFSIPRKNYIFNKWIRHTGWYPDYQLRLFKKGLGKFPEKHVHEKIEVKGAEGKLNHHLIHQNYRTISQFIAKLNSYTDNEAENLIKNNYQIVKNDIFAFPKKEFLNRYFVWDGFKDQMHGLSLSMLMSFYYLVVFLKIWEKKDFLEMDFPLPEAEKELKKMNKELIYWLNKKQNKGLENLVKNTVKKVIRQK